MDPLLPNISQEIYQLLWEKSAELASYTKQYDEMRESNKDLKRKLMSHQNHFLYRSPLVYKRMSKRLSTEQALARFSISNNNVIELTDSVVLNFIKSIIDNRQTLIYRINSDPQINQQTEYTLFYLSMLPVDFFATYVIPPVFGFFSGYLNVSDFIESVSLAFDVESVKPAPFLKNFSKTFLCAVLTRFFLMPQFNKSIFKHLSGVAEFYNQLKIQTSEEVLHMQYSNFYAQFLMEMTTAVPHWPDFIKFLFQRLSRKFSTKFAIVITVINYCILFPLLHNPKLYGVVPQNCNLPEINFDSFQDFVQSLCDPSPISLRRNEGFERGIIANLVAVLLDSTTSTHCGPEVEESAISAIALLALSRFETDVAAKEAISSLVSAIPSVAIFTFSIETKRKNFKVGESLKLLVELLTQTNPSYHDYNMTPRLAAIRSTLSQRYFEYERILARIDTELEKCQNSMAEIVNDSKEVHEMIMMCEASITRAEASQAVRIVAQMREENNVASDAERRRTTFANDVNSLGQFCVWNLDTFFTRNQWCADLMPLVARTFHSQLVSEFPVNGLSRNAANSDNNRKLLAKKAEVLEKIKTRGVDAQTMKVIQDISVLEPAASKLLAATKIDSPCDCMILIEEALKNAEELFSFANGVVPEANQLMPILATLFVVAPMEAPFSFSHWLKSHLGSVCELRPAWFKNDDGARMEHFFQLGDWIQRILDE